MSRCLTCSLCFCPQAVSFLTTEYIYMAVFMVRNALRNSSLLLCAAHASGRGGARFGWRERRHDRPISAAWQNSVTRSLRNADARDCCQMAGLRLIILS